MTLGELFQIITQQSARRADDRLWIARRNPPRSHKDFILGSLDILGPQKRDINFEQYFRRMAHYNTGVNIHSLEDKLPELTHRIASLKRILTQVDGAPVAQRWDTDTFFGTYPVSPLGIHKDTASVFSFALMGKRTYYMWPSDYFQKGDEALFTPDPEKIEPHLKYAEQFVMQAGDVIYWPSNRWHVILSDGQPSVVAQVSAYFPPKDLPHWNR